MADQYDTLEQKAAAGDIFAYGGNVIGGSNPAGNYTVTQPITSGSVMGPQTSGSNIERTVISSGMGEKNLGETNRTFTDLTQTYPPFSALPTGTGTGTGITTGTGTGTGTTTGTTGSTTSTSEQGLTPEQKEQQRKFAEQAERDKLEVDTYTTQLKNYNPENDPNVQAQINSITGLFDARIADMERANKSRLAAINTLGIRTGSQYTGGLGGAFGGIVSEEERQGITRIGELQAKKQEAIQAAKDAARTKNWDQYSKLVQLAQKTYEESNKALADFNKAVLDQNKARADAEKDEQNRINQQITNFKTLGGLLASEMVPYMSGDLDTDTQLVERIAKAQGIPSTFIGGPLQELLRDAELKFSTDDIKEFNFENQRRTAQGLPPFQSLAEFRATFRKPEDEMTGALRSLQLQIQQARLEQLKAQPLGKPPTAAEEKVANFASSVEQANPIIKNLEKDISEMNILQFEAQRRLPSAFQSEAMQQYMQAGQSFINAILRQESGAAVPESEFQRYLKQYLPAPGDTETTLRQKRENRELQFERYKKSAGGAYSSVEDLLGSSTSSKSSAPVLKYNGKDYFAGDIVTNANGQKGRVEPDGSITPL